MAILYKTDGTQKIVEPQDGKHFTLEEMQAFVGGYIQIISLPDGRGLVLNEDGKSLGLSYNKLATFHGMMAGIADDDFCVGDALLCSQEEWNYTEEDEDD